MSYPGDSLWFFENDWSKLFYRKTLVRFPERNKFCVKSVLIQSYSGPCFPAFGLNTERYSVSPYLSAISPNVRKY